MKFGDYRAIFIDVVSRHATRPGMARNYLWICSLRVIFLNYFREFPGLHALPVSAFIKPPPHLLFWYPGVGRIVCHG